MGAKTAMLAYVDAGSDPVTILKSGPVLDRAACRATLAALYPSQTFRPLPDRELSDVYPPGGEICIGCFPGLTIIATRRIISDPSEFDQRYLDFANGRKMLYHLMISTVSAFSYGVWEQGSLARGLTVDADNGVGEDIGAPLAFELPYWAGEHRYEDEDQDEDAPFHPLDLANAALLALFGYTLEGDISPEEVAPEAIPLMCFALKKPFWKFW